MLNSNYNKINCFIYIMDNIKAFFIFVAIFVIIVLIYPILKKPSYTVNNRQYIKVEPTKLNQKPEVKETS